MIDSVRLWLPTRDYETALRKLTNMTVTTKGLREGPVCRGGLANFRVKVLPGQICLAGSLAKFRLGNNVESLDREGVGQALDELGQALGQPINEARVFRLDIGRTFEVQLPPAEYWQKFATPPRMKSNRYEDGLTFFNSQLSVLFYDKVAQILNDARKGGGRAEVQRIRMS